MAVLNLGGHWVSQGERAGGRAAEGAEAEAEVAAVEAPGSNAHRRRPPAARLARLLSVQGGRPCLLAHQYDHNDNQATITTITRTSDAQVSVATPLLSSSAMPPPSRGRSQQLHPSSSTRLAYHALQVFLGLSIKAKAILVFFAVAYLALMVTVLRIGTHGLLEYLSGFALYFSHSSFGPSLLILIITVLSFPPLVGYGTSITVCGLSFGSPESGEGHGLLLAWAIAAGGCLMGATASFLVGRWGLARYGDRFDWVREVRGGKEWRAMEKAVERKGWKMAILIRVSRRAREGKRAYEVRID